MPYCLDIRRVERCAYDRIQYIYYICDIYHISHIIYHISYITYHISHIIYTICDKASAALTSGMFMQFLSFILSSWLGALLQDHLEKDCLYALVTCPSEGCTEEFQRRELENHLENSCTFRIIVCHFCGKGIPLGERDVSY